jgi:hypothetical protein
MEPRDRSYPDSIPRFGEVDFKAQVIRAQWRDAASRPVLKRQLAGTYHSAPRHAFFPMM